MGNPPTTRNSIIYFDNTATSWPKPPCVAEAMNRFLNAVGANPGRSGHRLSVEAGRIVYNSREAVAKLFNAPDPLRPEVNLNEKNSPISFLTCMKAVRLMLWAWLDLKRVKDYSLFYKIRNAYISKRKCINSTILILNPDNAVEAYYSHLSPIFTPKWQRHIKMFFHFFIK